MNKLRPTVLAAHVAATAEVLNKRVPDREPAVRASIYQVMDDLAPGAMTPFDALRAVWQLGYEQRDADGRAVMGRVGALIAQMKPVIDACAAQMAASPTTITPDVPDAWRADFDALRVFLEARDRKQDDGDSLQGYADAEAALTAQLGLSSGLDRLEAKLVARRDRYAAAGEIAKASAMGSVLKLMREQK